VTESRRVRIGLAGGGPVDGLRRSPADILRLLGRREIGRLGIAGGSVYDALAEAALGVAIETVSG
jgi:hypothetical protein